ncbi:MAG: hypothetical protein O2816_12595 [Planctomycetota bacterium]|nr:hypothetical protein [Planctomycetota bacterium]
MFDPQMELLLTVFVGVVGDAEAGKGAATWGEAQAALRACGEVEEDVALAVEAEDAEELQAILDAWFSGQRHLLEHDRGVLKRALKAFRKSLKVTLLAAESSLGGGPMSGGRKSAIVGIRPPARYPKTVWDELVRQGRLVDDSRGLYELPPE